MAHQSTTDSVSEAHPKDEILMEECPYALSLLRFLRWCQQLLLITTMHDKSTNVDVGHRGILCLLVKLEVPKFLNLLETNNKGERELGTNGSFSKMGLYGERSHEALT